MPIGAAVAFVVTAYGLGCDAPGPYTKAGTTPVAGFTIAADPAVLPLGSIVTIEGLGERMVHDVGAKIKGRRIDVFVSSCSEAVLFGRQELKVTVVHVPSDTPQVQPVIVRGTR
jgi:3D (Asp-Asp-Asp) domain-containing protein